MPTASDYTIEVRDRDFVRVGQLAPEYVNLKFTEVFNGIGAWEVILPVGHPLLDILRAKGAGLIITDHLSGRVYSGRTRSSQLVQSAEDPEGSWTIDGVHENVIAAASLVYGDPANDAEHQTASNWGLTAAGETVMKAAVDLNIGPSAIASRRYPWLTVAPNQLRGSAVSCSSRFDILADLLTSLGTSASLGWRFSQSGDGVVFDVYEPADKTGLVRLDIRNGGIESNELGQTAPGATEVLVMGQGQGEERTILLVTSDAATAEATDWGIRWESTKDQRQTDDPTELLQAGQEELTANGETINSLKVSPSDAPGQKLGIDWYIGDRITVVVLGQETPALVTQVATSITSAGVIQQATIGDPTSFNYDAKVGAKLASVEKRVGQVEKQIGVGTAWGDIAGRPATFPTTWGQVSGAPTFVAASDAERDAHWGAPTVAADQLALQMSGAQTIRPDKGWTEQYYAVKDASNPGGVRVAGWYPVQGKLPQVRYKRVADGSIGTALSAFTFDTLAAGALTGLTYSAGTFHCASIPGEWFVSGAINIGTGSTSVGIAIRQNSTSQFGASRVAVTNSYQTIQAEGTLYLAVGDSFDLATFAGATIGVVMANGGIPTTYIDIKYVGPA